MTIDFTKYENKYLNLFRAGTTDDPYVIRTDLLKIVNNLAILEEYPNKFYHVTIPNFTEIYVNAGTELTEPEPYTFICDYNSRRLIFNSQHNGEMISATYQGMGVILTYACTVALSNSTEEVPVTIQDMIDDGEEAISAYGSIAAAITAAGVAEASLESDISTGNTLHTTLSTDITNATNSETSLEEAIQNSTTAKNNLDSSISNSETKKSALDTSITTATTSKNNLDSSIAIASQSKSVLDSSILSSTSSKNALDSSITSGNNLKESLDSDISTGSTLHSNLQNDISSSNTAKSNLETSINNAGVAKTNLDSSISTSETKKSDLDESISSGTTLKNNLDTSIGTATTKKSDLDTSINNSTQSKSNLDGSISTGNSLKSSLDSDISTGSTLHTTLAGDNGTATGLISDLEEFEVMEVFDNTKYYKALNKVQTNGSTYQCILDLTSVGTNPASDSTHWVLVAAKGAVEGVVWSDIADKPSSITTDIDDAVSKKHAHSNQTVLDNTTVSFTTTEETKLSGIEVNANNYTHPTNHPASIITQDSSNRFVSDTEKSTWNAKVDNGTTYQILLNSTTGVFEVWG